jgi:nicotinate-nucleotide adenylyltransferase
MLTILRQAYPNAEVWFLIGSDSLADLAKWRTPDQIIALARLGVLSRPGYKPDPDALVEKIWCGSRRAPHVDLDERIEWLMGPSMDVSSSALRARARRGLPMRFLMPPSVEAYILKHQLYGRSVT